MSETIKVAVIGAAGRMGAQVCRAVDATRRTSSWSGGSTRATTSATSVVPRSSVEFSVPDASPANVAHCVERGVHVVVGTTGWDETRLDDPA